MKSGCEPDEVATSGVSPRRGTVLLIEDEKSTRQVLSHFLAEAGYTVVQADDGQAGMEIFQRSPDDIDLIVLDVNMPRLSGDEALRRIRSIRPDVPAVVSTGSAPSVVAKCLADLPVDEVFFKPYRVKNLIARLSVLLDSRKP